jgi:hypothetical protein
MASQVKFPPQEENTDVFGAPAPLADDESASGKFWRKMREQPLVPIGELAVLIAWWAVQANMYNVFCSGSFATCGALIAASHYLRTGNRENFQRALRWRVGLQGLTVVAAVIGTVYLGSGSPAAPSDSNGSISTQPGRPATVSQTAKLDERRAEERAQLQARLREAELREEQEEKRRAEQVLMAGSRDASQYNRSRPSIGQDRRDRSSGQAATAPTTTTPQSSTFAQADNGGSISRALKNLNDDGQRQETTAAGQRRMV